MIDRLDGKFLLLKFGCLLLLTVQTSTLTFLMGHSLQKASYIPASLVVSVEVLKLILCFGIELWNAPSGKRRLTTVYRTIKNDILFNGGLVFKLAIPAFLYAIQNNLGYFALSRLNPVSFQVIQQLKILTTALFAVILMRKRLTLQHWISLTLLTIGVIFVQLSNLKTSININSHGNVAAWMGFLALLANSLSSGFAGIYFEKIVKGPSRSPNLHRTISKIKLDLQSSIMPRSVWVQSMELGFFGLLFSLILAFTGDNGRQIQSRGFFTGFDGMTLLVIIMQAVGGILVAMVVKYADTILKAFATSSSIVLSGIVAFGFLGHQLTMIFLIGSLLVAFSVYIYAVADKQQHMTMKSRKTLSS